MSTTNSRKRPRSPQFPIKVRRGTSGFGLFAGVEITRGRFIVEYWGRLVTNDEAEYIGGRYLFDLQNGKTLDGSSRKNVARYANHSHRPNCEVRIVGNRVYVFSRKRIAAGEELTYDYGKEYVDHYIGPNVCRCEKCREAR